MATVVSSENVASERGKSRKDSRSRRAVRSRRASNSVVPSIAPTITVASTLNTSGRARGDREGNQSASLIRPSSVRGRELTPRKEPVKVTKRPLLQLHSATVSIPHPAKRATHGEDASFQTSAAIGVFDGVGSWSRRRVNAGNYSRRLASLVETYLTRHRSASPQRALADAASRNMLPGSCTATVATVRAIENSCFLQGINLGDGQLIVIRDNAVVFQTVSQQHGFNVPYQVSFLKRRDLYLAQLFEVKLLPNDIIVMATDGLWDNVFMSDIIATVVATLFDRPNFNSLPKNSARPLKTKTANQNKEAAERSSTLNFKKSSSALPTSSKTKLQAAAESLAYVACKNAHQRSTMSPFAHKARRLGRRFSGGKLDDITVVVAQPVLSSESVCTSIEVSCPKQR